MKIKSGFTLIELLVAITIVAILSTVGLTMYSVARSNARDAKRITDVNNINKAFEVRYRSGLYEAPSASWFESGYPLDPTNDATYYYIWSGLAKGAYPTTAASTYTICAKLENSTGNSSDKGDGTIYAAVNGTGGFYCKKNLQ